MAGSLLSALIIGMLAVPEVDAYGKGGHGGGGHSGGHAAPRPPHVSAPRQAYQAPRMPHMSAPARVNYGQSQAMARNTQARAHNAKAHTNNAQAHTSNAQAHTSNAQARAHNVQAGTVNPQAHINHTQTRTVNAQAGTVNAQNRANHATAVATRSSVLGTANPTTTTPGQTTSSTLGNGISTNAYTYGHGASARSYQAYGYGRGYRNRYYGSRYGYGRSQGNNRAIISRLQSVNASLARIDHDYQGHRVRAMQSISMAIRQLTHRSMVYNNTGFASGANNGRGMGMQQGGFGMGMQQGGFGGGAGRRGQPMTQAQSDSRMSQSLRSLQGINMQLVNQGSYNMGHSRASGHVQRAIHELNTALSIR
ncbi:MAG: hypothetical protein ACLQGP_18985 [Isosphaeraceae bacterium]